MSTSSPPKLQKSGGRCATKIGSAIARTSPITPPAARGPPDGRRRPSGPSAPAPESLHVDRAPFCQQPFQASFAFKWAGRARDIGFGASTRDADPLIRTHDGSHPPDLQLQRAKSLDPSCAWRRIFAPPPRARRSCRARGDDAERSGGLVALKEEAAGATAVAWRCPREELGRCEAVDWKANLRSRGRG